MERLWWCASCGKWVGPEKDLKTMNFGENLTGQVCPLCESEDVFKDEDFICSYPACGKKYSAEDGYKLGDRCPKCEEDLKQMFIYQTGKLPDGVNFPTLIEKPTI